MCSFCNFCSRRRCPPRVICRPGRMNFLRTNVYRCFRPGDCDGSCVLQDPSRDRDRDRDSCGCRG